MQPSAAQRRAAQRSAPWAAWRRPGSRPTRRSPAPRPRPPPLLPPRRSRCPPRWGYSWWPRPPPAPCRAAPAAALTWRTALHGTGPVLAEQSSACLAPTHSHGQPSLRRECLSSPSQQRAAPRSAAPQLPLHALPPAVGGRQLYRLTLRCLSPDDRHYTRRLLRRAQRLRLGVRGLAADVEHIRPLRRQPPPRLHRFLEPAQDTSCGG